MNILLVNLIFMMPKKEDVFLLIRAPTLPSLRFSHL